MHDFLLEARDQGYIAFITDCGGGGLSSAVGESARLAGGCEVWLDKVPLKYQGLDQWEIWISESQERMVAAVKPEHAQAFIDLAEKHAVEVYRYRPLHRFRRPASALPEPNLRLHRSGVFWKATFRPGGSKPNGCRPRPRGLTEPVLGEPADHTASSADLAGPAQYLLHGVDCPAV